MSRPVADTLDLAELPDYAFGHASLGWWAVFGFMLIEGMGFVLAIGAYFYLLPYERLWPPGMKPDLFWGTLTTMIAVASEIPNVWLSRRARECSLKAVQLGLVVMTLLGFAMIATRIGEMTALNVRWDKNAYGSIVWALIALHTLHLVTDTYDDVVLAALSFRKEMTGRKFADVADNALYWHFIVWSWVVIYVVVYWVPRWT